MTQRQVGTLDLPALVVEADELVSGVGAVVSERGQQPVGLAEGTVVGGTCADLGFDDAQDEAYDTREVRTVWQQGQYGRVAGGWCSAPGTARLGVRPA